MKRNWTILVVDRNRHVRRYLKRELGNAGYDILLAENCHGFLHLLHTATPFDLIVIDPDLPDADKDLLLRKLQALQLQTPVVIHSLITDYLRSPPVLSEAVTVEKDGNSIERLKEVIEQKAAPDRYQPENVHTPGSGLANKNGWQCP